METLSQSPLAAIEPRLRSLLPADLYASSWLDPSPIVLTRVFEHLRTLQRILYDYVPRQVSESLPKPGQIRHEWQEGTLMFTDLAGFTPLLEANSGKGKAGAKNLLTVLNSYFAEMIEIVSKSGGTLLEFTGDALLAQFQRDRRNSDTAQAVRAGLRMQRAMTRFAGIETPLGMRIGLHTGRFLTADIGTPRRMEHVLLGHSVQATKHSEGSGKVGRVNLTMDAYERVKDEFRFEPGKEGYMLVVDDFSADQLGEYDISASGRRMASALLMDRSVEGLLNGIGEVLNLVEPLACFIPDPVLNLLVESAASRRIPPDFPTPTVIFVNIIGLPESLDKASPDQETGLIASFSRGFALINSAVEARGGVLKKVTYHLNGSDCMIYFGAPNSHTDDPIRAADAALAIREVIMNLPPPTLGESTVTVTCKIGLARGAAFSAEIGEPRGRREFNILGDTVNTSARLMGRAETNQILMTESVYQEIASRFDCEALGSVALKGKAATTNIYALRGHGELEI